MKPVSTSASDTRLGVWPNSCTMSSAVSTSTTSLILCIAPSFIKYLMTSTARSAMRLASSWMVMTSGITTSRTIFSRDWEIPIALSFSRSRLRFSEASERSRCFSSKALLMVSLTRSRFSSGLGVGVRVAPGLRRPLGPPRLSSSSLTTGARVMRFGASPSGLARGGAGMSISRGRPPSRGCSAGL